MEASPVPRQGRAPHPAIDGGISFMDNSWDYNEPESEKRMGLGCRTAIAQGVRLGRESARNRRLAGD